MMSEFSFVIAIVLFNLSMIVIAIMRRRTAFLLKHSISALVLLASLSALRIILPLDFSFTKVIESYKIVPEIRSFFNTDILLKSGRLSLGALLLGIWILGSVIVFIYAVLLIWRDRRIRKKYRVIDVARVNKVIHNMQLKRVDIIVSPDVDLPKVIGLFKAHIYLPDMVVTDYELEVILKHELQHFNSRDTLIKFFYLLLSVVFWWNPIVHVFQKELDRVLELRCDASLTRNMNDNEKIFYAESILSVMKQLGPGQAMTPSSISALVKTETKDFMEQRFKIIFGSSVSRITKPQIVLMCLVVLLFISSFLVIVQPAYLPPVEEIVGATTITLENAYIVITEGGAIEVYIDGQFHYELAKESLETDPYSNLKIIEGNGN